MVPAGWNVAVVGSHVGSEDTCNVLDVVEQHGGNLTPDPDTVAPLHSSGWITARCCPLG